MIKQHKFPTMIVDNFFETPTVIREYALSKEFSKNQAGNWPGYRTDPLHVIDREFYFTFANKLFSHFIPISSDFDFTLDAYFQYVDSSFDKGWVHCDTYVKYDFAGVVYLTPDPPENTGTAIYDVTEKTDQYNKWDDITILKMQYMSETCSQEERDKIMPMRDEYNSIFKVQDVCSNKFNRCLIFSASQQHSEQNFFGTTKFDSRLTLPFFGKINTHRLDYKYSFQHPPILHYENHIL